MTTPDKQNPESPALLATPELGEQKKDSGLPGDASGPQTVRGQTEGNDDFDAEDYFEDDGYCNTCGGEGFIITCVDDLCHGGGYCIHGDGERVCPECKGRNLL